MTEDDVSRSYILLIWQLYDTQSQQSQYYEREGGGGGGGGEREREREAHHRTYRHAFISRRALLTGCYQSYTVQLSVDLS